MYKKLLKLIKSVSSIYISAGYPLLPVTKFIKKPMRWYFHQSPLLRHDSKQYLKPALLSFLHRLLVVDHPIDFDIYHNQIKFRSSGSSMSVQGYYVGEIEYHLFQYLVPRIKDEWVVLDVGAHHGLYSLIIAYELQNKGWNGKIYAFEPDPRNYSLLEYNIQQNQLESYVILHQQAVSDKDGIETILIDLEGNANNALLKAHSYNHSSIPQGTIEEVVEVIKLDSLIDEIPHVNLIKIDIQGGEFFALRGAEQIIKRDRPILLVESVAEWESTNQIKDILFSYGYDIHGIDDQGNLCPLDSESVFVSWDWVALPKTNN